MSLSMKEQVICPRFEEAFSILGKKWAGLIIDALLDSPKRYKELLETIPAVSERMLAQRLKELEQEGIVQKLTKNGYEAHYGYCLTEKGQALEDVMIDIHHWADEWMEDECDEE